MGFLQKDSLVEESIRVFRASDEQHAARRADEIGRAAQHSYTNEDGEVVQWSFIRTLIVQDLSESELEDGVEVFSALRPLEPGDDVAQ